jgi:hypothetical protein
MLGRFGTHEASYKVDRLLLLKLASIALFKSIDIQKTCHVPAKQRALEPVKSHQHSIACVVY